MKKQTLLLQTVVMLVVLSGCLSKNEGLPKTITYQGDEYEHRNSYISFAENPERYYQPTGVYVDEQGGALAGKEIYMSTFYDTLLYVSHSKKGRTVWVPFYKIDEGDSASDRP
ncbi:hypothetical protein M3212_05910 [Alkalihalobacillus oceani]|uniref:hypothetical protein n=1 Tax=Halalkalibacter oceani TaxID=1653776 RepID=UPI00203DAEA0|nr:hypothetical protein [Halalkalibacter oceani]MCM3760324.1 hypothetical protein [Halalkalibacter oceani]